MVPSEVGHALVVLGVRLRRVRPWRNPRANGLLMPHAQMLRLVELFKR
jgi:hypothetical protein